MPVTRSSPFSYRGSMPKRVPIDVRRRITELWLQEKSQREICHLTGKSLSAVNRIIQAYRDEDGRLSDAPRSGRHRCTSEECDLLIVAAAVTDPFQSAGQIKAALNLQASEETIRRRMREAGLRGFVAAQKPHLTDRQKAQRLQFSREYEHWTREEWTQVIFSDESTFTSRWDQERRVWRPYNCRYFIFFLIFATPNLPARKRVSSRKTNIYFFSSCRYEPGYVSETYSSGRCAVNVWGAISKEGLGPLVRLSPSFTADAYCEILDYHLVPYALDGPFKDGCYFFQHDRSPVHTARAVQNLLQERAVCVLDWPPKGADLNPIENVWGAMKESL